MTLMNIFVVILLISNAIIGLIKPNKSGHFLGWFLALIYYLMIIGLIK